MALNVCQLCAVDFTLRHFLIPLVDGMQREGWNVTSVCSDGKYVEELRRGGHRIITLPITRGLNPLKHVVSLARLVLLMRRERFDIVHVHTPVAALLGRAAAFIAGVPLVVYTAHGFYFHDGMRPWKRRLFAALEWIGGRGTDLLFTQSREDAHTAAASGFVPADRIVAIGNGVDPARFPPASAQTRAAARAALGIPADALVVGMVGRMVAEKGYPEFLSAAASLAVRVPELVFVAIGERLPSDHAGRVDTEVARTLGAIGARLVLAGPREDVPALLPAFDLFTLPSHREGMPRTIIEAMMVGLPVVATNIRGSREEVVEGETGLLVPVGDPGALAAAWHRLLEDEALRRRLGAAGRLRALLLYDEAKVVALQIAEIRARLPDMLSARG